MDLRSFAAGTGAVAVLGLPMLASFPVASAQPAIDCASKVVDQSGKLDIPKVQTAITELENTGADVYVRTFQNTPGGNMDAFWESGRKACVNWRDVDGSSKDNVIMVSFGMDRNSAIYYGANFDPSLRQDIDSIRANKMNTAFRGGNFTGGVVDALHAVMNDIVTPQQHNVPNPGEPATSSDSSNSAAIVGRVFLFVFLGLLGLVALAFGGSYVVTWLDKRAESKSKMIAARVDARATKDEAAQLVNELPDKTMQDQEFLTRTAGLPESIVGSHRRTLDGIQSRAGKFSGKFTTLTNEADMDPNAKLSTDQYKATTMAYAEIVRELGKVQADLGKLNATMDTDKQNLSPEGQVQRLAAVNKQTATFGTTLQDCSRYFSVAAERKKITDLQSEAEAVGALIKTSDTLDSHKQIMSLENRTNALASEIEALKSTKATIVGAGSKLKGIATETRRKLQHMEHVDPTKSLAALAKVEAGIDNFVRQLDSRKTSNELLKQIEAFAARITATAKKALKDDRDLEAEAQRKRSEAAKARHEAEVKRRQTQARRSSSYSSSRSSSDGLATGYIAGSLGSSSYSSPSYDSGSSSYSSPSFDGGSSGSFGGGFDGGSSGGW